MDSKTPPRLYPIKVNTCVEEAPGNIWQKDAIAVINPTNGAVEAVLDLSGLRKSVKSAQAEVLNGIAYNAKTNTIFVTGKYWDKVFEIKVFE